MRYIVQKFKLPDHWYPGDLQARAKVDEALAWFPNYLRCGLFFHGVRFTLVHLSRSVNSLPFLFRL